MSEVVLVLLEIIAGNIREGKTAFAVERCRYVHLQNLFWNERVQFFKPVPIYTNFPVKYEEVEVIDVGRLLDLESLERGLLVIDEAYTWLESRVSSSKLNRYVSSFLFQSGKRDVDVIGTVQLGSTVDLRFYDLCHIQRVAWKDVPNQVFHYQTGVKCGLGVRTCRVDMKFSYFQEFWNDYKSLEPVKPLGLDELQVEMEKFTPTKLVRRIDGVADELLKFRQVMGWFRDRDVMRYQVEDLLLRLGKPVVLSPLVTNRLKCLVSGRIVDLKSGVKTPVVESVDSSS